MKMWNNYFTSFFLLFFGYIEKIYYLCIGNNIKLDYMKKINGFTEADIITSLRLVIDLAGDGGCSPWRDGEYEACIEYLDELKSRLESKYSVECCECDIDNA